MGLSTQAVTPAKNPHLEIHDMMRQRQSLIEFTVVEAENTNQRIIAKLQEKKQDLIEISVIEADNINQRNQSQIKQACPKVSERDTTKVAQAANIEKMLTLLNGDIYDDAMAFSSARQAHAKMVASRPQGLEVNGFEKYEKLRFPLKDLAPNKYNGM